MLVKSLHRWHCLSPCSSQHSRFILSASHPLNLITCFIPLPSHTHTHTRPLPSHTHAPSPHTHPLSTHTHTRPSPHTHRDPDKSSRPTFPQLSQELSQNPHSTGLLKVGGDNTNKPHPQADVLGAPLEAGHSLYTNLQHSYHTPSE